MKNVRQRDFKTVVDVRTVSFSAAGTTFSRGEDDRLKRQLI